MACLPSAGCATKPGSQVSPDMSRTANLTSHCLYYHTSMVHPRTDAACCTQSNLLQPGSAHLPLHGVHSPPAQHQMTAPHRLKTHPEMPSARTQPRYKHARMYSSFSVGHTGQRASASALQPLSSAAKCRHFGWLWGYERTATPEQIVTHNAHVVEWDQPASLHSRVVPPPRDIVSLIQ